MSIQQIKELREVTGAGLLQCKEALEKANGDLTQAKKLIDEASEGSFERRQTRNACEGKIGSYIHHDSRKACIVEVNCETDFVARTPEFAELVHNLALHIVAMKPEFVCVSEIPLPIRLREEQRQEDYFRRTMGAMGLLGDIADYRESDIPRKVRLAMDQYYAKMCLLNQPYVKDPSKTVLQLVKEYGSRFKENIIIKRFALFEIEGVEFTRSVHGGLSGNGSCRTR